jgi:hypothetical protein
MLDNDDKDDDLLIEHIEIEIEYEMCQVVPSAIDTSAMQNKTLCTAMVACRIDQNCDLNILQTYVGRSSQTELQQDRAHKFENIGKTCLTIQSLQNGCISRILYRSIEQIQLLLITNEM